MPSVAAPALSVIVPAYNEQENVPLLAHELREVFANTGIDSYEVLFVDDGSADATAERVRDEARRHPGRFRLIRLGENCGESAATEAGLRRARGRIVVVMDCDLQNPPEDIPRLLAPIQADEADCACGWRTARGAGDNAWRRLQSHIANSVRNALTGDEVRDAGCTFRAFRRECVERVKVFRGMHRFLPTLIRLEGYRVVEVPVGNRPRRYGISKYGMRNRVFAALRDTFAIRWMRSRVTRWRIVEES